MGRESGSKIHPRMDVDGTAARAAERWMECVRDACADLSVAELDGVLAKGYRLIKRRRFPEGCRAYFSNTK